MGRIFDIVQAVRRGSMPAKGALQCKLQVRFSFNWTSEPFQTESELLNYLIQLLNMQSGIQRHVLPSLLAFLLTGSLPSKSIGAGMKKFQFSTINRLNEIVINNQLNNNIINQYNNQ